MTSQIIQERLNSYNFQSKLEEFNAIKEIAQEIALSGLARTDFFKHAAFQGGTCLRICHNLYRFSEDLDFILKKGDAFSWSNYINQLPTEFAAYNLNLEIQDRSELKGNVKSAFLKENSFGRVLSLVYPRSVADHQIIRIKLEIDTNPPAGSSFESRVVAFPYPFSVVTQDKPSLFAGKSHALLCRKYTKGRDWFDFLWFISHSIPINLVFLENALMQLGPWQGKKLNLDESWLKTALRNRVREIDWSSASQEVLPFLRKNEADQLRFWNTEFFLQFIEKLKVV